MKVYDFNLGDYKNYFLVLLMISILFNSCELEVDELESKENSTHNYNPIDIVQKDENNITLTSDQESVFIDKIYDLKEVEKYEIKLNQISFRNLKIWIADTIQEANEKYILYNVGEDNGDLLVTNFHFARKSSNYELMGYDVINGKVITLTEWKEIYSSND
jgi:hypothetical protein